MLGVLPDALLQHRAEVLPELGVVLGVAAAGLQLRQHAVGHRAPDAGQHRGGLQHLARDVQRQVLGVHHAHHEAQPGRQQAGLVGDEHAPHVQAHPALALALDRLEGLGAGHEQQRREVERALRAPVQRRPGLVEEVAEVAVELGVALLRLDLGLRLAPERRALVRRLVLAVAGDGDRDGDVVGPLADDRLQAEGLEELLGVGLDVQHDVGARLGAAARRTSVYSPLPSEAQVQASSAPARREVTSTRSATMKAE